jgi:hypothetical protein
MSDKKEATIENGVRKRVWNYKLDTLDKMKTLRDSLNISMPEVIDNAITLYFNSAIESN